MSEMKRDLEQVCRDEMSMHGRILEALADGEKSVPEVAELLSLPAPEVMVWMMGMRRYGMLVESSSPNDEDYFTYRIVERKEGGAQ